MAYDETVLLLCGNFNPIGNMHLRMFGKLHLLLPDFFHMLIVVFDFYIEIARDQLIDLGYSVYKGVVVPFEEDIDGQTLVSLDHRVAMIKYALTSSDWIQLSTKQCRKLNLNFIIDILQHHQVCFVSQLTEIIIYYYLRITLRCCIMFSRQVMTSFTKIAAWMKTNVKRSKT